MDEGLCRAWQELASGGEGVARALPAARREALLDHVEECATCGTVAPEQRAAIEALYRALAAGDDELDALDRATLARLHAADARDEADVARAVEESLLPSLSPRALKLVRAIGAEATPRAIHLATEAVAMLIARATRAAKLSDKIIALDGAGAISVGERELVPGSTTVREIARVARVSAAVAQKLAAWMPVAALAQPRLLRGLTVEDAGAARVDLRVLAGATSDGPQRWRRARRASSLPPEIAARLPEGAAAAARTRKRTGPRSRIKKEP
jgi:hypothetical protein